MKPRRLERYSQQVLLFLGCVQGPESGLSVYLARFPAWDWILTNPVCLRPLHCLNICWVDACNLCSKKLIKAQTFSMQGSVWLHAHKHSPPIAQVRLLLWVAQLQFHSSRWDYYSRETPTVVSGERKSPFKSSSLCVIDTLLYRQRSGQANLLATFFFSSVLTCLCKLADGFLFLVFFFPLRKTFSVQRKLRVWWIEWKWSWWKETSVGGHSSLSCNPAYLHNALEVSSFFLCLVNASFVLLHSSRTLWNMDVKLHKKGRKFPLLQIT